MFVHGRLQAQALPMRTLVPMPAGLVETSGLLCTGPNRLWTHNDSGGEAKLYQIDTIGAIIRTIVVRGVPNIDWEDITQDAAGHVYIGDFGNNDNNRTNLVILRMPQLDTVVGDTVTPERIDFSYADQFAFPPADPLKNFDMEAFVAYGDSLYLFSKNRTVPFDGYTKMYRLPQAPGTYVAELIDSFYTGPGPGLSYWIAGAGLSPAGDHLVLASYGRCFIFSCFTGADFFGGAVVQRTWSFSQKEAVAWCDSTHMYITDELLNGVLGGQLYLADMGAFIALPDAALGPDTVHVGDTLFLPAPSNPGGSYLWSTGATTPTLPITQAGTYWLQVTAANGCKASDTITVSLLAATHPAAAHDWTLQALPNPSDGNMQLQIGAHASSCAQWRILDPTGRSIAAGEVEVHAGSLVQCPAPKPLSPGMYAWEVTLGTDRKVMRIVVQ
jgi:hypothetical protein